MSDSNKIEALLFDIDGSIMKQGGPIEPETAAAFRRLNSAGLKMGPATGKNADYGRGLACGIGLSWDFISAETGAQFLRLISENPVAYRQKKLGHESVDLAQFQRVIGYDQFNRTFIGPEKRTLEFRPELKEGILTMFPPGDDVRVTEDWVDFFKGIINLWELNLKLQRFSDGCIDIVPVSVSKSLSIQNVCSLLSIEPINILTVVDGANDHELTQETRTIAVGNADQEIKNIVRGKRQNGFVAKRSCGKGFIEGLKHFAGRELFKNKLKDIIWAL